MKKLILNLCLVSVVLFSACKKDDADRSRTELVTDGSWNLTSLVSDEDGNGTYEYDDLGSYPTCIRDNFYVFKTNYDLEIHEGNTRCSPADPQIDVVTWSFGSNETVMFIDNEAQSILELTSNTLKLRQDNGGGTSTVATFTKR